MKGILHIIFPDKPVEVRMVSAPVSFDELQRIVGGSVEVIQLWDHHLDFGGQMRSCIALCNDEAPMTGGMFNLYATAVWQFICRSKGKKHDQRLTGPVVVCMGDQEFLESVLD